VIQAPTEVGRQENVAAVARHFGEVIEIHRRGPLGAACETLFPPSD
jgi:hypothetical protein